MIVEDLSFPTGSKEDYLKELFVFKEDNFGLQFGTVFLKKGTRIPEDGYTHHDQRKIVYLIEGVIEILSEDDIEGDAGFLKAGQIFLTDYFEGHGGIVKEDAKILFVLFGKKSIR